MKIKLLSIAAVYSLVTATLGFSAPLTETTAVHLKPDATSPAITYLKAGTEPTPAADSLASTPAGWMAVDLSGPFQGYVESKAFTKGLDVKPGTPIRLTPQADGPVLAIAEKSDRTTITGLHGKWTQVSLQKNLVGYIKVSSVPGYLPPIATAAASSGQPTPSPAPSSAPVEPAPVAPMAYGASGAGQPATTLNVEGTATLPRQFAGVFASTRSVFHPRRPYDWALNDNSGQRYAYLDISKLLLTNQPESYVGHWVVVFGAARPTADGKDIVIQVESLQLK